MENQKKRKTIIVEYPSWNPYLSPTIGNFRCFALGHFVYQILKINKKLKNQNYLLKKEYFVNDLGDPSFLHEFLGHKKAKIHESIYDFLKNERLSFYHESSLFPSIKNKVLKVLKKQNLLKELKTNSEGKSLKYVENTSELVFKYDNHENLILENQKPLYFFNDLCYGYKNKTRILLSFVGEDQKKHALNLMELNKRIGLNNRIYFIYGLVYKKGTIKYSKRNGDAITDIKDFEEHKNRIFLFLNNQKMNTPIKEFSSAFNKWCYDKRKSLASLKHFEDSVVSRCCDIVHVEEQLIERSVKEIFNGSVSSSAIVDYVFKKAVSKKPFCCRYQRRLLKSLFSAITLKA